MRKTLAGVKSLHLSTETLRKISGGDPPENVTAPFTLRYNSECEPCTGGGGYHTAGCV